MEIEQNINNNLILFLCILLYQLPLLFTVEICDKLITSVDCRPATLIQVKGRLYAISVYSFITPTILNDMQNLLGEKTLQGSSSITCIIHASH